MQCGLKVCGPRTTRASQRQYLSPEICGRVAMKVSSKTAAHQVLLFAAIWLMYMLWRLKE